jgi:hypothetical protein
VRWCEGALEEMFVVWLGLMRAGPGMCLGLAWRVCSQQDFFLQKMRKKVYKNDFVPFL